MKQEMYFLFPGEGDIKNKVLLRHRQGPWVPSDPGHW